jgi:hypothetical protein
MIQVDLIIVIADGHRTNKDYQTGLMDTHQRDIQHLNNSEIDTTITCPKTMIQFDRDSQID